MNNNKNKNTDLQFTELTPADVVIHEDLYIGLLSGDRAILPDKKYLNIYYDYAIKEITNSKSVFQKTFE